MKEPSQFLPYFPNCFPLLKIVLLIFRCRGNSTPAPTTYATTSLGSLGCCALLVVVHTYTLVVRMPTHSAGLGLLGVFI